MPDPYSNPGFVPPTRPYKWVPGINPTGSDTPIGFAPMRLERGQFRNDAPIMEGFNGGDVTVTYTGTLRSSEGSQNNPILVAFRPRAKPDTDRGLPPSEIFEVGGADFSWQVEMVQSARISAITIEYALYVDLNDPALPDLLEAEDHDALRQHQVNPTGEPPAIDWSKYKFGQIVGVDADGVETEYPVPTDNIAGELPVTGTSSTTQSRTIKFATSFVITDYPILKKILIKNRMGFTGLNLVLKRVMIFEAVGVNLRDDQLPCSLLEYAFPVRFPYNPTTRMDVQRLPFASDSGNPNFHFKLFSPEERIAAQYGMAHSINLRFFVFSMPLTFIDPVALAGGPTSLFFVIFIGPAPGRRSMYYTLTGAESSVVTNKNSNRLVSLDNSLIEESTETVRLEKIESDTDIPAPAQNASWARVEGSEYSISNPPSFAPDGPFVSPYLFLDNGTGKNHWYRTVQLSNAQAETYGAPFKNEFYSERTAFKALPEATATTAKTTLTRRVKLASEFSQNNPLIEDGVTQRPLAFFVSEGFENLVTPISFKKGPFKFGFKGKVEDTNFLTPTHVYLRFWLVPIAPNPDLNDIYQWRSSTEFHFESADTGTKLVNGPPRSMADLIISPPLSSDLKNIQLVRYIDESLSLSSPISPCKVVIGVYAVAYPSEDGTTQQVNKNSRNLPKITLELDGQYSFFETPIEKAESNVIFAQRAARFDRTQYSDIAKPLVVTPKKAVGGELSDSIDYPKYEGKFLTSGGNAFADLITLESVNTEAAKFHIPFTTIPAERDEGISLYADFCTNGPSVEQGRVLDGEWTTKVNFSTGVDNDSVAYDVRIEAFLVDLSGQVRERIFRSKIMKAMGDGVSGAVTHTINIQFPMIITGQSTQLVMRLVAYPYSRTGEAVDVASIKQDLGDVPFGVRVDSFVLETHTLSRLNISQVASFLGSPAFYEDLPLHPTVALGQTPDFWFVVSDHLTNVVVVDVNDGLDMTGCLYSIAWFLNAPKGMELRVGAQGFSDNTVWFRTVLADGKAAGEDAITAVEDKQTGTAHVAYTAENTASGQSVQMMSDATIVKHASFDSPFQPAHQNSDIAGKDGSASVKLTGTNPNLQLLRTGMSKGKGAVLGLITQKISGEVAEAQAAINLVSGGEVSWTTPDRDFGAANFSSVHKVAHGLDFPAYAQSELGSLIYIVGFSQPGTILLKEANIFDASSGAKVAEGSIWVVDGNPNVSLQDPTTVIIPSHLSGLSAVQTSPGVLVDDMQRVTVAYVLEGNTSDIKARTLLGGQEWCNPYTIVRMKPTTNVSKQLEIFAPTLYWHHPLRTAYCAFWAAGKIFVSPISLHVTAQGVLLYPAQLVAGSRDFDTSSNEYNGTLRALVNEHLLRSQQLGTAEQDVPQQRIGMFVSDKWPFQGQLFVYYRDINNDIYVRRVSIGGQTGAPKKIS